MKKGDDWSRPTPYRQLTRTIIAGGTRTLTRYRCADEERKMEVRFFSLLALHEVPFPPPLLQRILDRQLSPPHFCEILARSKASKLGNFEKLCGIFKEQRGKKNVEARNIKRQVTRTYMQAVPTHTSLLFLFIFISFYWYIAHAEEKTVIHLFFLSRRYTSFFILSLDHRKVIWKVTIDSHLVCRDSPSTFLN